MNINQLDEKLKESLDTFVYQAHCHVKNNKDEYLNEFDYDELARQFFYVMDDFKTNIIKYLESQK